MAKYTAINIGPIIKTLSMARRPRELWASSYMFSHLMKCIIRMLPKDRIISPAFDENMNPKMGLYPDRVFVIGEVDEVSIKNVVEQYCKDLGIIDDYLNVMFAKVDECGSYSEAIKALNQKLDLKELFEKAVSGECEDKVKKLISMSENSPLFKIAFDSNRYPIDTIQEVASNGNKPSLYSYSNYFCIIQADGDNMGKIISGAKDDKVKEISNALLEFGQNAVKCIEEYSTCNMPLYAGGDDLLFVVPVVGNEKNIFELIEEIDNLYEDVKRVADNNEFKTTMSYGIAINYEKFPLYEALDSARTQLFDIAKNVKGKNAIAWELRKHSGGAFAGALSKNDKALYKAFKNVIDASGADNNMVSAVAHKIRANEGLLRLWLADEYYQQRNENFFEKFMDGLNNDYKKAALKLLNEMYADAKEKAIGIESLVQTMYGMLRTAKFVKGETSND